MSVIGYLDQAGQDRTLAATTFTVDVTGEPKTIVDTLTAALQNTHSSVSDTDQANVSRFEVLADCEMGSEIGSTGAIVDFIVTANDVDNSIIVTGQGFYSASQTDILVSQIEGTGTIVSASTFNFTASESYEGGTNDFDDVFGDGEITGGTITITAPGSGGWTVQGSII